MWRRSKLAAVACLVCLCVSLHVAVHAKHRKSSDEGKNRQQEEQAANEAQECVPLDLEALEDYSYCKLYELVSSGVCGVGGGVGWVGWGVWVAGMFGKAVWGGWVGVVYTSPN